jgi:hypothetical protein
LATLFQAPECHPPPVAAAAQIEEVVPETPIVRTMKRAAMSSVPMIAIPFAAGATTGINTNILVLGLSTKVGYDVVWVGFRPTKI